ncbi:iron-containing redox enzyme family protein [Streptomyces sp. NPDC088354]|uniref:iron-containing redox enzyme family protein n=1 Tax=unclassified Streptomyces TaxID=2593676 RepID=UPI0029ABF4B7|nr:iron-containing redox enzyme family protein [Streptomyces sp. MI02-7b]MDX3075482.1 iron-containing redox enzyme family protein [Streptomyces sp. MI02-7b]
MTAFREPRSAAPALPQERGEVSSAVIASLRGHRRALPRRERIASGEPYGDDLQLALYVLYELHYQGFDGVAEDREWDPALLDVRRGLEERFLSELRAHVPGAGDADDALADILVEPAECDGGNSVSHYLRDHGSLTHLREYAALRSLYHLKEADPHAWLIPRLHGRAKAAMVAVEFDEFGAGHAEDIHARLFADLMADLHLDTAYGRYVDAAPCEALATVNLMSLFGLHRALRGAAVGHFATLEVTSSPGSRRIAQAMRRLGAGPAAERFYDEHVEADAVHEQVVRHEVIAPLLAAEPQLTADVAFGIEATGLLEDRLGDLILRAWRGGRTALRTALPEPVGAVIRP